MSAPSLEEQMDQQTEAEAMSTGVQAGHERAMARGENEKRQLVELLTDRNDVGQSLPEATRQLLDGLLAKAYPLAKFSSDQLREFKFRFLIDRERFFAMHPRTDSQVQGATRRWVHDDPDAGLQALNQQERFVVDEVFKAAEAGATPGENFSQQEVLATQISESRVKRGDTQETKGLLDRLRGG